MATASGGEHPQNTGSTTDPEQAADPRPTDPDAVAREAAAGVAAEDGRIPDETMERVAEAALEFCLIAAKSSGITLFPYQVDFARRIIRSVLLEDTAEITALFARQSGKTETVAVVVSGLMVLLPTLADTIPDERVSKFKKGFHVGYFAPDYGIVDILTRRMKDRLYSHGMRELMADPELGMADESLNYKQTQLPNGSFARGHSTNPRLTIEGHTYHLIICDESQRIPDWRITKSIHPMAAQTAGTIVKLGTPIPSKCEFWAACQRNKRKDLRVRKTRDRQHWQVDYRIASEQSPRYAKYMKAEKERLGEESDDFRMSYRLHWIMERGEFLSAEQLSECGIQRKDQVKKVERGRPTLLFKRSSNVVTFDRTNRHVAGLDIGRTNDSTIASVGKVFWEHPIDIGGRTVYYIHVANWLELHGDDHEAQYPQLLDFFGNYSLDNILVDATGRGDPVYSRLRAELEPRGVPVTPYVFSQQSKDQGFRLLLQELQHGRVTYPMGAAVKRLAKFRRFQQQFDDLEKTWRGKYMVVEAPKKKGQRLQDAHDDYPDSLMLMLMATQTNTSHEVETLDVNPFFGNNDRALRGLNRGRRDTKAWWRT